MNNILIDDFIEKVLENDELKNEDKKDLLSKLVKKGMFVEGFYFREANDENCVEIWYRNVDELGQVDCGNTGWNDPELVISEYIREKVNTQQK